MSTIACFVMSPTGLGVLTLRRFTFDHEATCPAGNRGHDKSTIIDVAHPVVRTDRATLASLDGTIPPDDPRWPAACAACDYQFTDDDHRQVNQDEWYEGFAPDGSGERIRATHRNMPPGAMFHAAWMDDNPNYRGPTGEAWVVVLPPIKPDMRSNFWSVYGPSSGPDRAHWTVTGTPPDLTATPSIQTSTYHGWLTAGKLVD